MSPTAKAMGHPADRDLRVPHGYSDGPPWLGARMTLRSTQIAKAGHRPGGKGRSRCARPALLSRLNELHVDQQYKPLLLAHGLDSLDALFDTPGAEVLGKAGLQSWRERLRLTLDVEGRPQTLYLKRFRRPPARARRDVRRCGLGASSVAGTEWVAMLQLAEVGVPTAQPVAFGEELVNGREVCSAILTAAAPGDALERVAASWQKPDRTTIRRLIEATADLAALLHEGGYVHRDLYLSHIFYDAQAPPDDALHLIDLQRVMKPRWWRRRRWIVKDLASLNFSVPPGLLTVTDRMRWLRRYVGLPKLHLRGRRLVRRVGRKTRRIARHERRRNAEKLKR